MEPVPITNVNGVRIANFSSPHPFMFTTGDVLAACTPEQARRLMLNAVEVETPHPTIPGLTDIKLQFNLSREVLDAVVALEEHPEVDIVLVPLPVMEALKQYPIRVGETKCRVVRMADRVAKTIHPDRFCI